MGLSNYFVGILNAITAMLSVVIIGAGIWLATKHDTTCLKFLQWPVIIIGIVILLVSLAGLVGSCCRVAWLLWVYLAVMLILIVLLFCFTIFAFVVTHKGAGDAVSGKGFKEYHLGNYSSWLERQVEKSSHWRKIKNCLSKSKICKNLNDKYTTVGSFNQAHLSPTQSGCCKPPTTCGFSFQNATSWADPQNIKADSDCATWSNDPTRLCYDCNSCKAGVLQNIKREWRKVAIVNAVVLVLLIFVYSFGCCAFRNVRREDYGHGYGYGKRYG